MELNINYDIGERKEYLRKLLSRMSTNFEGTVYEICYELRDYIKKELEELDSIPNIEKLDKKATAMGVAEVVKNI